MNKVDLSIVIPIYNEQESLLELYKQIQETLKDEFLYEIIFVNDGSTDDSDIILKEMIKNDNSIRVINFFNNRGKSEALNLGFKNSKGSIVITIDGDLQDDPKEFINLIKSINDGSDMVTGWKKNRKDSVFKRFQSKIFNSILRFFTGLKIHDFNCGLKAYKLKVVKTLNIYGGLHRFIPALAKNNGFKVNEIIVNHRKRKFGESKYGASRIFHGFYDLITVLFLNKYFNRPLHLFGFLGFLLFTCGLIINLNLVVKWYIYNQWITPFKNPLFFLGILLIIVGIQFFSTGLIGELIVYFNRKNNSNENDAEYINFQ